MCRRVRGANSLRHGSEIASLVHDCRARSLAQIYQALTAPNTEQDVRLALLLRAKLAANGFDLPNAKELIELVDRETASTLRWGVMQDTSPLAADDLTCRN